MLVVAEAAGDAAAELDEAVDGFGAAVARPVGVEVGQQRCPPAAQSLPEPGDLRDRAGRQPLDQLLSQSQALSKGGWWNTPLRSWAHW